MTVPIYCVSLVFVIFTAFTSDYTKDRAWHLVGLSLFAVMSLAIVAGVSNAHVRYAFLALGTSFLAMMLRSKLSVECAMLPSQGCLSFDGTLQLKKGFLRGRARAGDQRLTLAGWGGIQSCVLLNFAYMGNSFGRPAEKRAVAIGLIK